MTVKRFVGANARECLRRVKAELGPDAIVVSNKTVEGGVEIVAMSSDSLDALSHSSSPAHGSPLQDQSDRAPATSSVASSGSDSGDDYRVTLSSTGRKASAVRPWVPQGLSMPAAQRSAPETEKDDKPRLRPLPKRTMASPDVLSAPQVASSLRAAAGEMGPGSEATSPQNLQLMAEMQTIKALLERQLAGFAWGELGKESPAKALLMGEMLEAGFSGQLARRLVQELPVELSEEDSRKWLRAAVNRRLRTLSAEGDIIDRGGVFALVGPTGVGKTTTTAKLAARCVVRYGADRLALLTTDGYRIGAHEQLRIYGRILGVPVFVVRDGEDLRRTLSDLRDKHMVLIDTVGMSQRDRMVAEQAAMLTRSGEVNRLLLLNATSRGDTLDDVVRAYAGEDLAGCILTKVDEAVSLAPALDCVVRNGMTLAYVANGQRVPEDLHLPNRNYLLHRAFKVGAGDTAHRLKPDEISLALSTRGSPAGATLA